MAPKERRPRLQILHANCWQSVSECRVAVRYIWVAVVDADALQQLHK